VATPFLGSVALTKARSNRVVAVETHTFHSPRASCFGIDSGCWGLIIAVTAGASLRGSKIGWYKTRLIS
jgi:hypothetical protein